MCNKTLDAEAFLESNTFYCEPLKARLSYAQCEINRAKPTLKEKNTVQHTNRRGSCGVHPDSASPYFNYKPFPCESCRGHELKSEEKAPAIPAVKKEAIDMAQSKKRGICPECHKEGFIKARGLDPTCYHRLWTNGTLDEKYPPAVRPAGTSMSSQKKKNLPGGSRYRHQSVKIVLDLTLIDGLQQKLRKKADSNFRTVPNQILWELMQICGRRHRWKHSLFYSISSVRPRPTNASPLKRKHGKLQPRHAIRPDTRSLYAGQSDIASVR